MIYGSGLGSVDSVLSCSLRVSAADTIIPPYHSPRQEIIYWYPSLVIPFCYLDVRLKIKLRVSYQILFVSYSMLTWKWDLNKNIYIYTPWFNLPILRFCRNILFALTSELLIIYYFFLHSDAINFYRMINWQDIWWNVCKWSQMWPKAWNRSNCKRYWPIEVYIFCTYDWRNGFQISVVYISDL